jgi:hypothetical protein
VGVGIGVILIGVGALLLLPTYIFLSGNLQEKQSRLTNIQSSLSSSEETNLPARLTALSNSATTIIALSKKPSPSDAVRGMLSISRPGIRLSAFTYTPGTASSTLLVTGTAETRDALRNYQIALQNMPSVTSAKLPVSVYAQDTEIPFTITTILVP